jgi:hypothetical protein
MHPKNKAERRLISQKKSKKRKTSMRTVIMSESNVNAAIESFLFSLRLIDGDEKVNCVTITSDKNPYQITLERNIEQEGTIN